jgi:uncharacterized protein YbjQ (UPF0145 family)
MKISTSSFIDENKYKIIGIVHGVSIRSFSFFRQLFGRIRGIFGGKAEEFEKKYLEAWNEAWKEMEEAGAKRGADAIYAVDIDVSEISMGERDGMIVLAASGTAVKEISKQYGGKNGKKKKIKSKLNFQKIKKK